MQSHRATIALLAILTLVVTMIGRGSTVEAVVVPPGAPFYIQTSSPSRSLVVGDWYTHPTSGGGGGGYHYFALHVPCGWPSGTPIYIDLFHPDLNTTPGGGVSDEIFSLGTTVFEVYGPGTPVNIPTQPAPGYSGPPGGTLFTQTYTQNTIGPNWTRLYTITSPLCGAYILRAQTNGNADNSWRLRFGSDDDNDPNTTPPANYDNPDGLPGTGDELAIGLAATTFQHDQTSPTNIACLTLYEYVAPGQSSVTFHNFDMDNATRVRYYSPSDTYDPNGLTGGTLGTLSGNAVWNNGTTSRGGDTILSPEPGWWRIVSCINNDNQFIQEGQTGALSYMSPPPAPNLTLSKTDGVTVAAPGDVITYTLTFTNTGNPITSPGAAYNVVLTDTLPLNVNFLNCTAPNGTCNHSSGTVVYTRTNQLNYNATDTITITVQIHPSLTSTVTLTNTAVVGYQDGFGNQYPQVQASDSVTVNQPNITLSKTDGVNIAAPGQTLTYTLTFTNTGLVPAHNIVITDTLPTGLTFGSCTPGSLGGSCSASGSIITYTAAATLGVNQSSSITITAQIPPTLTDGATLINTATLTYTDSANNPRPAVTASDTTTVPVQPNIVLSKTDGVTTAAPGQTLTYTLTFTNTGPGAAHNIVISDTLPPGVSYQSCSLGSLAGSCSESGGTVTFTLTNPLAAGASASVTITVQVTTSGPTTLTNTATLNYTDSGGNARTPVTSSDTTRIPGPTTVDLIKQATLVVDNNNDDRAGSGDIIEYTIVMTNTGSEPALLLTIADTPDVNTTLIVGSVLVNPSNAVVVSGNNLGDTTVEVTLNELAISDSLTITFRVQVNTPLPDNVSEIANQAIASGVNISSTPSDDPTTTVPDDPTRLRTPPPGGPPTAIVLTEFRLVATSTGWDILWSTGAEVNTRGFLIYRSTAGRDKAQLLTPLPIPARGSSTSGASYRFSDHTALVGIDYSYWLVEIELDGTFTEYGPLHSRGTISQQYRYFIPLIGR